MLDEGSESEDRRDQVERVEGIATTTLNRRVLSLYSKHMLCRDGSCDVCFLLEYYDNSRPKHPRSSCIETSIREIAERILAESVHSQAIKFRRRFIIRFMWGMLAGTILTSIFLVSLVWWLDIGRHLF